MFSKRFWIAFFAIMSFILINNTLALAVTELTYDGKTHPYNVREVTLMLNNDKFEPSSGQMPPIILNDRTLVPVREVFEYLGGKVDWEGNERKVTVNFEDKTISLWIDKIDAVVNGKNIKLDVPAKIINDKTMVPVRFISEQGGLVVGWNQETYTVDVKFPKAKITNIGFATINGINCLVATASSKITGYKYFSLPAENIGDSYLRLVLDIENCDFAFDTTNATFEQGMLRAVRFGKQENDVNRIVLDLREDTDYVVTLSKDRIKLYFAMAKEFVAPGDEKPEIKEPEKETVLSSGEKNEAQETSGESTNTALGSGENNDTLVSSGENQTSKTVETSNKEQVSNKSGDQKKSGEEKQSQKSSSEESGELIEANVSGENIIIDGNNPNSPDDLDAMAGFSDEETSEEEEIEYDATITSIKYSATTKRIKIKYEGKLDYQDSILTNPNRVVIDIQSAKLATSGPTEIPIKNSIVSSIRFSQYTKTSVRIVFDLSAKGEYKLYKRSSELQVEVNESTYKNIKYKKNTSNSQITLQGTQLKDLEYQQYEDMFKYIIKFNPKDYDFGNGSLNPEDKFVKSIITEEGQITICDTGDKQYAIRQSGTSVVITVRVKEEEKIVEVTPPMITETTEPSGEEKVEDSGESKWIPDEYNLHNKTILIDVGHGGSDPGACNGDDQEKDFNLNIATYLYELLSVRGDVNVVIDRSGDTYLNREDRVNFATKVKPDFIISIHNNSLENKSYSGTMVLYYNNDTESDYGDLTSKECAEIVLEELVHELGTINRGVVSRGDLHILSKTPCPSILCEVCFVSNDAELARLKTKAFQETAAMAMYNGVCKILNQF